MRVRWGELIQHHMAIPTQWINLCLMTRSAPPSSNADIHRHRSGHLRLSRQYHWNPEIAYPLKPGEAFLLLWRRIRKYSFSTFDVCCQGNRFLQHLPNHRQAPNGKVVKRTSEILQSHLLHCNEIKRIGLRRVDLSYCTFARVDIIWCRQELFFNPWFTFSLASLEGILRTN